MARVSDAERNRESHPILMIEDHHEAYFAWRERSFRRMTLVHLDAHIDFGFQEVKAIPLIVQEAKTVVELKSQLAKAALFNQKQFELAKLTHIGNYIYPAMRDGIVDAFYWVIPGDIREFRKCKKIIKKLLRDLWKEDPCPPEGSPLIKPGFIQTGLYGRPLTVCVLETLPRINAPALLDIDTDFMVIDSLRRSEATAEISSREPWITLSGLAGTLRERIHRPRFTTIAYSVNGGFTPMIYKTLGDLLARELDCRDRGLKDRLHAGDRFRLFREVFERKDFRTAGTHYHAAVRLNAAYRAADNTYGPLHFQAQDYRRAEREWQGMLTVDSRDANALAGLGRIRLLRKRYPEARRHFKAALRMQPDHREALAGLAQAEFHSGNYGAAETMITAYEQLEPMQSFSRYLSGRIREKTGDPRAALERYKEALQLGMDDLDLLERLVRLSRRWDRANLEHIEKRCADCWKVYQRLERKALGKKGKTAGTKRAEGRFRKLLASFRTPVQRRSMPLMKSTTRPSRVK